MATRRGFLGGLLSLPFLKAGKAKLLGRRSEAVWDPVGIGGPIVDDSTELSTLRGISRSRGPHCHARRNYTISSPAEDSLLPSIRDHRIVQCFDPNCKEP